MIKGFRDFISRGNVIDLAVGVIIGSLFSAIVTALVENIMNPLIAAIFGQPNFDDVLAITLRDSQIRIGVVLTAIVNFLLTAIAVYFFIVVPMNKLKSKEEQAPAAPAEDVALLTEIRDLLKTNA